MDEKKERENGPLSKAYKMPTNKINPHPATFKIKAKRNYYTWTSLTEVLVN